MPETSLTKPYSGGFSGSAHLFAVRVYFEDTDLSGIVYHANYLRFMERARSDMLRSAGIDQRGTMDSGGGYYAVHDLRITYRRPAKLDDGLLVTSQVLAVRAAACEIRQVITRPAISAGKSGGDVLTEAVVTAAFLGPDGRPRRQPAAWRAAFAKLMET